MIEKNKLDKTYFDVLGLCCSSEIPVIETILNSLDGVKNFSVVVPTKTVIVVHDSLVTSQIQIVKALNRARLEANIRAHGVSSYKNKWPSPYAIISGFLLLLSFLKYFFTPLRWLAVGAIAVGVVPITLKAFASIRRLTIDINILVLIAVSGSVALRDYWEAATIVFLFTIADWLESRASHKATAVMSSLVSVVPRRAILADSGEEVNADEVKLNTVLAVKAGEVIPIDGVVVEGKCEVDEKFLTGESFPVAKEKDSIVWASTINLNGYVTVRTTAIADDCVVSRMAQLVEDAQNKKSKTQRIIDRCAKFYTPAIVAISGSLALVPLAFHVDNKKQWYYLSLVVLVSGCPCPLLLSTPVAMFCALSKAAKLGVMIKGAEHLETLARVKVIAFDKTGTITRGEFLISDFRSLQEDISFNTLLYWISSIESKSAHPMAEALVDYARIRAVEPKPENVESFEIFPGEGIYGRIEDKEIYIGNRRIASRAGCNTVPNLEGFNVEGKSVGYVFLGSTPAGIFSLSDECRTGAKEALKELKSMGIETVMLTGDSHEAAKQAQEQLGGSLDVVHSELLPEDKERIVRELQVAVGPAAMIGDGVNDAPALAAADIGISMGVAGSALATETGDVILMSNDFRKIPRVMRVARMVRRKIIENVVISILTKASIVGLAVAGHPLVWAAVMADVGTCLLVIFNSMMILRGIHVSRDSECHVERGCCGKEGRGLDLESQNAHGHGHSCCELKDETKSHKHEHKHNCKDLCLGNHEEHDHSVRKSSSKNENWCKEITSRSHDHHQHSECENHDSEHVSSGVETLSGCTKDHARVASGTEQTKGCCKNKHGH